jgi:hypothetical protein
VAASSDDSFGSRLLRAMKHPVSLVSAIGAVIAGVFVPVFVIPFALIWLVSVGVLSRERAATRGLPEISHLPPSIQADLLGVTTALDQLREAIRTVPSEQRPMFDGIEREAEEVRVSVLELGVNAGALHRHLETTRPVPGASPPEAEAERRERLLGRLQRYRETLQSLEETSRELADRAVDLAAGAPMTYDVIDERSPERKITEMKASMAALEEVMPVDTENI